MDAINAKSDSVKELQKKHADAAAAAAASRRTKATGKSNRTTKNISKDVDSEKENKKPAAGRGKSTKAFTKSSREVQVKSTKASRAREQHLRGKSNKRS